MTLYRLLPESLKGPRAYFTEWNKRNFSKVGASDAARLAILRKLKSLLLMKRNVIFAASDLNSPIAFQILFDNPELLDQGILLPALREDRSTLQSQSAKAALLKKNIGIMASDSGLLEAAEKYSALVSEVYQPFV